jgi:hypothetical protein
MFCYCLLEDPTSTVMSIHGELDKIFIFWNIDYEYSPLILILEATNKLNNDVGYVFKQIGLAWLGWIGLAWLGNAWLD